MRRLRHLDPPNQAIQLCKAMEPFRPFFMEDPFAPEDIAWFRTLRQRTSCPIATGELFVNRNEWVFLVAERLIDIHISAAGVQHGS
jgi:mannonate dehydratase